MNADLGALIPILIPILVIQVGLLVAALYDLTRPTRVAIVATLFTAQLEP